LVDKPYLLRELRDCLRGVDKLSKTERKKYFSFYLKELIDSCVVIDQIDIQGKSVRWEGDVISDCILSSSGLSNSLLERFLKLYT
jgi:hypothetical protein